MINNDVKYFNWEDAKNRLLRAQRGIGFEDIVFYIERCRTLERMEHSRRHGLFSFVVRHDHQVYLVPFVEDDASVLLDTIIPRQGSAMPSTSEASETMTLDRDELDIYESIDRGEWLAVTTTKQEESRYARYARATFRKDRRLNIRISGRDLEAIQKRALVEGLPYQTLISSLLHKFASGRLNDV